MRRQPIQPGDFVVYRKTKHSRHPGPRARSVQPTANGDDYVYLVDKYWVVVSVDSSRVIAQTRRGKRIEIDVDDPNLRRARWWESRFLNSRFPQVDAFESESAAVPAAG